MNLKAMLFKDTLALIKSERLREFTKIGLANLPDYFFEIPASSSGKYHSDKDRAFGGLVHHTKACCHVAYDLFRSNPFDIAESELDLVLVALHFHDGLKNGEEKDSGHTVSNHPLLASKFVYDLPTPPEASLTPQERHIICECIKTHSGKWNTDYKGSVILPVPRNDVERFVHLVDYIASRKFIEIDIAKV